MKKTALLIGLACSMAAATSQASTITWGSATDISGDTDVSTTGTSLWAYSLGGVGESVNGVAFTAIASSAAPSLGAGFTTDNDYVYFNDAVGSAFGALTTNYQHILGSGAYLTTEPVFTVATVTVTLGGLTAGHTYEVQFWLNDARNRLDMESVPREATIVGTSTVVDYNTAGAGTDAGLGQYIIGTFTADAATQAFGLTSGAPQLNAIQLRKVDIPEPSANALLGGMLALCLVMVRRRRA